MIERLGIVGVGLIGGSLGLALKSANACEHVVGCSRNTNNLNRAVERGAIDSFNADIAEAVRGCDVVVLAVPMGSMLPVLELIAPVIASETVVTDVGSAKRAFIGSACEAFGQLPPYLVPGHPIAGHENSGIESAQADLFQGRRVILTPDEVTDTGALKQVEQMWQACGAEVVQMDAASHDNILAATSHLPHMLAFSLVRELANSPHHDDIFRFAAGGLRDFTRIAESDPVMWRDICLTNKDAVLDAISRYREELDRLSVAIDQADSDSLKTMFQEAHDARAHFRKLLDARERDAS